MPEAVHLGSGKVRELYALDDTRLLLVATDRISTFDVVLPTPIPDKGKVLTGLSAFWFARTRHLVPNHLLAVGEDGRSLECRRLEMLPVEVVVRGYLAGSGWLDYRETGTVCGHVLPAGLVESGRLPEPIVTPATKASSGHDLNIAEDVAAALCPPGTYDAAREAALAVYRFAAAHAEERGIVVADTKFELGVDEDGVVTLADEALTPDSSRFWPADGYAPGRPAAVVRQAVRPRLVRAAPAGTRPIQARSFLPTWSPAHARATWRRSSGSPRSSFERVPRGSGGDRVKATVLIRPKGGILDPQGEAVRASLEKLGFPVAAARVGRLVDLELRDGRRSRGAGTGRADVRRAAREPADRELRDRDRWQRRGARVSDRPRGRGGHLSRVERRR